MKHGALPPRQRGMSIVGLIFFGLIIVVLLLIGAKLVPAVSEYIAVERAIQKIKNEGSTVAQIREAFDRHAVINDIKSISSKDLDITKDNERVVISYAYSYQVRLLDNVRLVIDFAGTSSDRPGKSVP
ncbi:MAG: DUF4845 domain-containing protein [Burkholderiales bacterium]|jgi:hypothetical protein|nr:DUF4845 domain-containing protein [Burkholderiales bacterium]